MSRFTSNLLCVLLGYAAAIFQMHDPEVMAALRANASTYLCVWIYLNLFSMLFATVCNDAGRRPNPFGTRHQHLLFWVYLFAGFLMLASRKIGIPMNDLRPPEKLG